MPDPQILNLQGTEVEIRLWRGTTNKFDAYFAKADGAAIALDNKNAIFMITDKVGGTVKYIQTNTPAQHTDSSGGMSRFVVPPSIMDGLLDNRSYTWKHQVVLYDLITGDKNIFFWGDARVLTPNASLSLLPLQILGVAVADSVGAADGLGQNLV